MLCYTLIHHSTITDTAHLLIFGLPAVRMVSPYKLSLGTFVLYVYRAELLVPYSARKPNNFTGREIIFQLPGKTICFGHGCSITVSAGLVHKYYRNIPLESESTGLFLHGFSSCKFLPHKHIVCAVLHK